LCRNIHIVEGFMSRQRGM